MDFEDAFIDEALQIEDTKEEKNNLSRSGFKCAKCNREFTLASNLTRHMRHNKICGISKGFECSNCHKIFSLNATMKDHYQRCIAEDPYRFPCPNCPKLFTFRSSLNKHLRGRCRTLKKKSRPKSAEVFTCKLCATDFFDAYICQKHEKSGSCTAETESQSHVCPHCARTFTMKSSLTKHLKGRCKIMRANSTPDSGVLKTEYIYQLSPSSNDVESEVFEAWFEPDDVIEECEDDVGEIIADDVESYIEIANEAMADHTTHFSYEIDDEISNSVQKTYKIKIDDSNSM